MSNESNESIVENLQKTGERANSEKSETAPKKTRECGILIRNCFYWETLRRMEHGGLAARRRRDLGDHQRIEMSVAFQAFRLLPRPLR